MSKEIETHVQLCSGICSGIVTKAMPSHNHFINNATINN